MNDVDRAADSARENAEFAACGVVVLANTPETAKETGSRIMGDGQEKRCRLCGQSGRQKFVSIGGWQYHEECVVFVAILPETKDGSPQQMITIRKGMSIADVVSLVKILTDWLGHEVMTDARK